MGFRIVFTDNNVAEEGHNIYRSDAPMDPQNMPAPIATVGADVTEWEDGTVVQGNTYYYRVGAFTANATVELISDEWEAEAVEVPTALANMFDHFDLAGTPDTYDAEVSSYGAEIVAAIRDGAIAESTSQVTALSDYGQHKWPQQLTQPIARMWVLLRDNASGNVLRVYAERDTAADPNVVLSEAATWTFEALWQGQTYTGTGTWEHSDNMGGKDFTSSSGMSNDDGSFAFKDGANTQGNQSRPSGDVFGAGNWNSNDSSATMNALGSNFSDFQGIVIFAPAPGA